MLAKQPRVWQQFRDSSDAQPMAPVAQRRGLQARRAQELKLRRLAERVPGWQLAAWQQPAVREQPRPASLEPPRVPARAQARAEPQPQRAGALQPAEAEAAALVVSIAPLVQLQPWQSCLIRPWQQRQPRLAPVPENAHELSRRQRRQWNWNASFFP
jgi:hypothetical protein